MTTEREEKRAVHLLIVRHETTTHSCNTEFDKEEKNNIKMDLWEIH
jgi:hypothetical protein